MASLTEALMASRCLSRTSPSASSRASRHDSARSSSKRCSMRDRGLVQLEVVPELVRYGVREVIGYDDLPDDIHYPLLGQGEVSAAGQPGEFVLRRDDLAPDALLFELLLDVGDLLRRRLEGVDLVARALVELLAVVVRALVAPHKARQLALVQDERGRKGLLTGERLGQQAPVLGVLDGEADVYDLHRVARHRARLFAEGAGDVVAVGIRVVQDKELIVALLGLLEEGPGRLGRVALAREDRHVVALREVVCFELRPDALLLDVEDLVEGVARE